MAPSLADKVVLITGAASGIGRSTALAFGGAGGRVVVSDIDTSAGEETVAVIRAAGGEACFIAADVTDLSAVAALVDEAARRYGRLDCAVNNAGVEGGSQRTADVTEADFDHIMAVNVKGVWLCLKFELKYMVAHGGGSIVNVASVAGLVGAHSLPVYAASKHAVVGLTRSAAVEYARKGVRVNAVCPAVIRTPMVDRAAGVSKVFVDASVAANPTRRLGEPEEVAAAILWLCSDAASFTNGAALTIDGGFTAQ